MLAVLAVLFLRCLLCLWCVLAVLAVLAVLGSPRVMRSLFLRPPRAPWYGTVRVRTLAAGFLSHVFVFFSWCPVTLSLFSPLLLVR